MHYVFTAPDGSVLRVRLPQIAPHDALTQAGMGMPPAQDQIRLLRLTRVVGDLAGLAVRRFTRRVARASLAAAGGLRLESRYVYDLAASREIKIFFDITHPLDVEQTPVGRAVQRATRSLINHVGFVFSDGTILHADKSGTTGVRLERPPRPLATSQYRVLAITGTDEEAVLRLAHDRRLIGAKYDAEGALGHVCRFVRDNHDEWYCSELVTHVLLLLGIVHVAGVAADLHAIDNVTPRQLYEMVYRGQITSRCHEVPVRCIHTEEMFAVDPSSRLVDIAELTPDTPR